MTVLKQDPSSFLRIIDDHIICFFALTLTQRNRLNSFSHSRFLCESKEVSYRIRPWRKDENEGSLYTGIFVAFSQIKSGRDNESLSHLFSDPSLNGWDNFIRSQRFKENDSLEVIQFFVPILRHLLLMGIAAVENLFKLFRFLQKIFIESLEG